MYVFLELTAYEPNIIFTFWKHLLTRIDVFQGIIIFHNIDTNIGLWVIGSEKRNLFREAAKFFYFMAAQLRKKEPFFKTFFPRRDG